MRFGTQIDMAGIIAPSDDADRAIRYLTKYLTKSIADTYTPDRRRRRQPIPATRRTSTGCTPSCAGCRARERCANWLRYGIQPKDAGPGLSPGRCGGKAHDRENLGLGGRRVLVSRQWSGKTLAEHRADRATVVREALHAAGMVAPEIERMAATVTRADGKPRFVWTDTRPDPITYARVILAAVAERQRWRAQYDAAKEAAAAVDNRSAARPTRDQTGAVTRRRRAGSAHTSASPDDQPPLVAGPVVKGERSESAGHEVPLTSRTGDHIIPSRGRPRTQPRTGGSLIMVIERMMSLAELSELLGVPLSTLYGWRHRGEGPAGYRLGKHVRFRRADVDAWLATQADSASASR